MPSIGALGLTIDDGLDSGIAMLLTKPPEKEITFTHQNCQILATPKMPYIICRFAGAQSFDDAFNKGSVIVQEALDILSMSGGADLATRNADDEYLAWWYSKGLRLITLVSTVAFTFKVGSTTLTMRDAQGNTIPSKPVIPKHHLGFRFYRLSQTSDDLYDAYRNMYLAFESLLSSQYPKGKSREIDWLNNSLTASSSDLDLSNLVPTETPDPTAHIITEIYNGARLPLFHAKDGKAYFAPVQNTMDRQSVSAAMKTLTQIVIRMANKWFDCRRMGGWVNLKVIEDQYASQFAVTQFVFTDNPDCTLEDDLDSVSIKNGVFFPATYSKVYGTDQRHNISGRLSVSDLGSRTHLNALYLVNDKAPLMGTSPDIAIDLSGFDVFETRFFLRGQNGSTPKYIYPR